MGESRRTLATTLRIEGPYVVVYCSWRLLVHVLVEHLTAEEGEVTLSVEGPV